MSGGLRQAGEQRQAGACQVAKCRYLVEYVYGRTLRLLPARLERALIAEIESALAGSHAGNQAAELQAWPIRVTDATSYRQSSALPEPGLAEAIPHTCFCRNVEVAVLNLVVLLYCSMNFGGFLGFKILAYPRGRVLL